MNFKALFLILIFYISIIGNLTAGSYQVFIKYPEKNEIIGDTYRYDHEPIIIRLYTHTLLSGWAYNAHNVSSMLCSNKRIYPGYSENFTVNDTSNLFYLECMDGTKMSLQSSAFNIMEKDSNISSISFNVWDRGAIRNPHIDTTITCSDGRIIEYNNKNGDTKYYYWDWMTI